VPQGGVADDVVRLRLNHLNHEPDNVARSAKLAVLSGAGDFAEHVFVEVALGIAIFHGDFVDHVHDFGEQRGSGDGEARAFHVLGVIRSFAAEGAQPGKNVVADERVHLARIGVLEASPTVVGVGTAFGVVAFREETLFHRLLGAVGLQFLGGFLFVQSLEE